jgi:hypothetical protein
VFHWGKDRQRAKGKGQSRRKTAEPVWQLS